ncbi:MAG: PadR family transcriptional regulator, regulatory protein PadR [Thermosediminibacterales bacterium]|nr:PadR family transcriptional regulator, regulatory protein PadR [Thermosediminibacterales bacterium]MDK2835361.1 PadR family transcriptional regulator, regulatory protein PadR [Thermosediminibacterales bacterium]
MCNSHKHECECHSGQMRRFIQPCMLLLLYEKPTHGYELMEKLRDFGFENGNPDPGAVYRNLRKMEEEGLVESKWETEGTGPAKRLYSVTPEGLDILHSWSVNIRNNIKRLEYFLERYEKNFND